MKFLIDMNLSPRWVEILQSEGWDSVHWSEIGRPDATDSELMEWAREHGRVVLTHDLDFGAMLAATQATSPSVAQIRAQDVRPESLAGNSTFDAARISRFEVTRVAVPRRWRSFHGLGAGFFCVRSSDSAQLSSYAVLHSRVVASRVCGRGRSESPSAAVACLGCRLNSVSPDGDGAARRWGCNHRTLVSAVTSGETPPLAE